MKGGQATQHGFALRRQAEQHLSTIAVAAFALQEATLLQLVAECHGRVMLDAEALGNRADGRAHARGQAAHGQQQLMLLRLDARRARRLLAERQEPTHLVAKGCQQAVL
jgi:hypothetical protein